MTNIHLRRLDAELVQQLKQTASHQHISVNTLILNLIQQGLGISQTRKAVIYHDLDKLSGTWTKAEAKAFTQSISDVEQIDKDLWK